MPQSTLSRFKISALAIAMVVCVCARSNPAFAGSLHCRRVIAWTEDGSAHITASVEQGISTPTCTLIDSANETAIASALCPLAKNPTPSTDWCQDIVSIASIAGIAGIAEPTYWEWQAGKPPINLGQFKNTLSRPGTKIDPSKTRLFIDADTDIHWLTMKHQNLWRKVEVMDPPFGSNNQETLFQAIALNTNKHVLIISQTDDNLGYTQSARLLPIEALTNPDATRAHLIKRSKNPDLHPPHRAQTRRWAAIDELSPLTDQELLEALCSAAEELKEIRGCGPFFARRWFERWSSQHNSTEINSMRERIKSDQCANTILNHLEYQTDPLRGHSHSHSHSIAQIATELLKPEDIATLNPEQLRLLRNSIYARAGKLFRDQDLQHYFDQFPWYQSASEQEIIQFGHRLYSPILNKTAQRNVKIIQKREKELKNINSRRRSKPRPSQASGD